MQAAYKSLKARLDRNLRVLTGHDGTAAGLIQDMVNDDMQCLMFKCRAHLMRIHAKVQQAKFAAVPFERRISQSKPGIFIFITERMSYSNTFFRYQASAAHRNKPCKACAKYQTNGYEI